MTRSIDFINLKGVRQNNLKGVDLKIPLRKLTVVTGVSGAGKSSLVFDTLHAEGQRRYVETFSPYVRQFMDTLDRPDLDEIENIRPSIAIEQTHAIRTSRSTVGTMTELTDYFKVWFSENADLIDPESGKKIEDNNRKRVVENFLSCYPGQRILVGFCVKKGKSSWNSLLEVLLAQGYSRCLLEDGVHKIHSKRVEDFLTDAENLYIVQDRISVLENYKARLLEAVEQSFKAGKNCLWVSKDEDASISKSEFFYEGFYSDSGKKFQHSSPSLFSFNSPIGACPECKGFGYSIEIDYKSVIADKNLSISEGALKPIEGFAGGDVFNNLLRNFKRKKFSLDTPWYQLPEQVKDYVFHGDQDYIEESGQWFGVKSFFDWLETKTYKMHVRMFLSRFRTYNICPSCHGKRLRKEALWWKWQGHTLPDLYQMPIENLLTLINRSNSIAGVEEYDFLPVALREIVTRLGFLVEVGLGYLTLDRTSRTLSGGEIQRVNLTSCIGTSLTDTIFVLDEPSIGLHSRDIGRLVKILRRLTRLGNTVVVVEHDEAIMKAADFLVEVGPKPGERGGYIVFADHAKKILKSSKSLTGSYLSGKKEVECRNQRRKIVKSGKNQTPELWLKGIVKNNLKGLDVSIPLHRFVCLSGVSGSGKSTLMNSAIHQGLLALHGKPVKDIAKYKDIGTTIAFSEVVFVDQTPLSRSSRSNIGIYSKAWEEVRKLYSKISFENSGDLKPGSFSFNSGTGRCQECGGMGEVKVEMQFLSDVFVTCPSCNGKRFNDEVLSVHFKGKNVLEVMDLTVNQAVDFFGEFPKIVNRLGIIQSVGLGYLRMGQTLSTLSGGEAQRLKLVRYLESKKVGLKEHRILLLDEPTTGLHREDIGVLLQVFQKLVDRGNSLIVIEHQIDVLKSADWILELGPESGARGGSLVGSGTPERIAQGDSFTAPFLSEALKMKKSVVSDCKVEEFSSSTSYRKRFQSKGSRAIEIVEATENNLKNVSVQIEPNQLTVITGVSGSGKSTLAFDILFSEGQRRFMESLSSYTRQFVEQLNKPSVRGVYGLSPSVAIQQRQTVGNRKSTVATITEVAHYLRLLYARAGVIVNPATGNRVENQSLDEILGRLYKTIESNKKSPHLYLLAPRIRKRKGHHEPVANWAENLGYSALRCDGEIILIKDFIGLDRYKEHSVEVVIADFGIEGANKLDSKNKDKFREQIEKVLHLGGDTCLLSDGEGNEISWFSTKNSDPETGDAFQELDPKDFSWNSTRGWCEKCQGHGRIWKEVKKGQWIDLGECSSCEGERLNDLSRLVVLDLEDGGVIRLPELLKLSVQNLLKKLDQIVHKKRVKPILESILPEIHERLNFMEEVGLSYLSLDRSATTLSGGEAQRIRLASQLGSYLSGVLYVLDEPSIGLHARDNDKLMQALEALRDRGNTVLVVEHDEAIMRRCDQIIDMGPGAGIHGGEVVAQGTPKKLIQSAKSLTGKMLKEGMEHPMRGNYREVKRSKKGLDPNWIDLKGASLRNLKNLNVQFPLNRLIGICGVSGAGKSTLVKEVLLPSLQLSIEKRLNKLNAKTFLKFSNHEEKCPFRELINGNKITRVLEVDQSPIGKTPRSVPATYIGLYDWIRKIFTSLPESKIRGFDRGRFSFNVKGGRCETCGGLGKVGVEMNFLPKAYVNCEECDGNRYSQETNEILYKGKSISEVMQLSFEEALLFFEAHKKPKEICEWMVQAGLGYIRLGQSSPTLSGGEAQRMKIVSELSKGGGYSDLQSAKGRETLYVLEEPSIGLHLSDCKRLIEVLHHLVDQGHSVLIIEHNTDLLAEMDWLIELGPEGGEKGGELLFQGNFETIKQCQESITSAYL